MADGDKTKSASEKGGTHGPRIKPVRKAETRIEAFRSLAQAVAEDRAIVPPAFLQGQARREFLRATLREDHAKRIEDGVPAAQAKFDELSDSVFAFFRATALVFYRDIAGQDADMPTVLALGDVHPANFGIMPDRHGVPIFGVNDFDEVLYAPFTWDLKRGATGFWIAAKEKGGLSRAKRKEVVRHFVLGYLEAMDGYVDRGNEMRDSYRMHNSPKIIRRLFKAASEDRKDWLWSDYLDPSGRHFRPDGELQPVSGEMAKFQKAVDSLAKRKGFDTPDRAGELRVKDVCIRHGQGTASLGLPRYYVLIEGPSKDASDDLIIEFKRARASALEGLTPSTEFETGDKADRIVHGQKVQLAHGDIFYGAVEIDGDSFMTRERAPFRDDIDLSSLDGKSWKKYARVCGAALAQSHALSDDLGHVDYDIEPSIVEATRPRRLFVHDIVRFASEASDRLRRDHRMFRQDHADGAFERINMTYR